MQQNRHESSPGRPTAKEWLEKWITHLGPKFKWEDQREPVSILKPMKRKSGKCEKGESKENTCRSTTCNELSVQREDNIWSLPLGQSKCNKEKNQSTDGNSIKTYDETHCVSTMFSPCQWISDCTPMKMTLIFYFRHDLLIYLFLVIRIPSYATLVQKDAKRRWHAKVNGNIRASITHKM